MFDCYHDQAPCGWCLQERINRLETELNDARSDIEAYRGALGYPVRGDHDGRLVDGTYPLNGLAEALSIHNAALRKALDMVNEF